MKNNMIKFTLLLMITICGFASCKKIEVDQGMTKFGEVYFDLTKAASYRSGNLQVRYNGNIIEMAQIIEGRIRVPEGEAKFEFLDKKSNSVLAEKTIVINSEKPEKYNLFQPSEEDGISFLDPNGQDNEEAAPEGFMKIKIANYAKKLIPFKNVDIILNFRYTKGRQYVYVPVDTIYSVGQTLDSATFRIVKLGERLSNYQPGYYCSFKESNSENIIKNAGGVMYYSHISLIPIAPKNVTTRYLSQMEYISNNLYINFEDKYYYIDYKDIYQQP